MQTRNYNQNCPAWLNAPICLPRSGARCTRSATRDGRECAARMAAVGRISFTGDQHDIETMRQVFALSDNPE
jgi:hypothetical protein